MENRIIFVAVHAGAGYHSKTSEEDYKRALQDACNAALKQNVALSAVEIAIKTLENNPLTNSGTGSNLTEDGRVECDASIMESSPGSEGKGGAFGAVGAISSVKNPITVATTLLREERKGRLPLGRIRPVFLVGDGALAWSKKQGIETVEEKDLVTDQSRARWGEYTSNINRYESKKRRKMESETKQNPLKNELYDTVGAICIDSQGNIAAGVSSGGISMKHCGRVGEAAIYGAGCWAEKNYDPEILVACSATGTGEHIMKSLLASSCCKYVVENERNIQSEDGEEKGLASVVGNFLDEQFLIRDSDSPKKQLGGLICARAVNTKEGGCLDFVWAHTTESMAIAYMSSTDKRPHVTISRLEEKEIDSIGLTVKKSGITFNLKELILHNKT